MVSTNRDLETPLEWSEDPADSFSRLVLDLSSFMFPKATENVPVFRLKPA